MKRAIMLVLAGLVVVVSAAGAQQRAAGRSAGRGSAARDSVVRDTIMRSGEADEPPVTSFTRELWVHALRQEPTVGAAAFGVTLEAIYHLAARAHDRWRRNVLAEVLARPQAWLRVEVGYDPESALITGGGGVHFFAEGLTPVAEKLGIGAYARYDRAVSELDLVVHDFEVGAHVSMWSKERRTYVNEKLGYRRIGRDDNIPEVDDGGFLQLRHHLVYVPSEDWTLTFVQEGSGRLGIGSDPHTNALRIENLFLLSPTMVLSAGPMVGVNLEYYVGPATSALSIPVGARVEAHPGPIVVAVSASYDVATMSGQRTGGLVLRGSTGIRF